MLNYLLAVVIIVPASILVSFFVVYPEKVIHFASSLFHQLLSRTKRIGPKNEAKNETTLDEFSRFLLLLGFSHSQCHIYTKHFDLLKDKNHSVINSIPEVLSSFENLTADERRRLYLHVQYIFDMQIKQKERVLRDNVALDVDTFQKVLSTYVPEEDLPKFQERATASYEKNFIHDIPSHVYHCDDLKLSNSPSHNSYYAFYNGSRMEVPSSLSPYDVKKALSPIYPELADAHPYLVNNEIHFKI